MPLRFALALLAVLAACASEPGPPTPTAPEAAAAPDTPASDPSALDSTDLVAPDAPGAWTVGVVDRPRDGQPVSVLTDLRVGAHPGEGYDRLVFEFDGPVPGYHVAYVDKPPYHYGSGEALYLAGDAWLEVRLAPAAAHTEAGEATLDTLRAMFAGPLLREAASTCDFEGHVSWVFGVSTPSAFRVTELADPARLVMDVRR